jgi:RNA polymerase sigma-70 factor (ECF subfamily)
LTTTRADDGFDEAFRAMVPAVRSLTWRILGDEASAEDATAETFVRVLTRWRRVRELPHRDAWIMRVATNVALDVLRRRRREGGVRLAPDPPPGLDTALRLDLAAAVARLPRRQREVVVLHHLAGLTVGEVADALGTSPNTVKTHGSRALATLRADLGPDVLEDRHAH